MCRAACLQFNPSWFTVARKCTGTAVEGLYSQQQQQQAPGWLGQIMVAGSYGCARPVISSLVLNTPYPRTHIMDDWPFDNTSSCLFNLVLHPAP